MRRFHPRLGLLAAPVLLTFTLACSQAAPVPQPTAAPALPATSASPASSSATTASPVASPIAAAATALSSPVATAAAAASPLAQPITTAIAAASPAIASIPVQISGVQLNPADPTITLRNSGASSANLAGWRLQIGSAMVTMPASAQIAPSGSLTLHLTSGSSSATDLYLGAEGAALMTGLQPGARVSLTTAQGDVVNEFTIPTI